MVVSMALLVSFLDGNLHRGVMRRCATSRMLMRFPVVNDCDLLNLVEPRETISSC